MAVFEHHQPLLCIAALTYFYADPRACKQAPRQRQQPAAR